MLCCESTSEERRAGNPHAAFCGSRRRVTASGDPVAPGNRHPYRNRNIVSEAKTMPIRIIPSRSLDSVMKSVLKVYICQQ
jgi:hypothetical protein